MVASRGGDKLTTAVDATLREKKKMINHNNDEINSTLFFSLKKLMF